MANITKNYLSKIHNSEGVLVRYDIFTNDEESEISSYQIDNDDISDYCEVTFAMYFNNEHAYFDFEKFEEKDQDGFVVFVNSIIEKLQYPN